MSQTIVRHEPGPILSRAVEYNGMVFVSGLTADDYSLDIKGQTEQVLRKIDKYLAAAGTNKTRILSTVIYVNKMANKEKLNEVWQVWMDKANTPTPFSHGASFRLTGRRRFTLPSRRALVMTVFITCAASSLIAFFINFAPNYHILGTDKVGNDVFYRSLKSLRTGLVIGSVTTLIVIPFALFFGVIAGYYGGIIDDLIQYCYSVFASIPSVLLSEFHTAGRGR